MVSARKSLLKPGGMALEVASFCSCGFVKFCIRFSHNITHFRHVKRIWLRIPLLNCFAVSYAVCLQQALNAIDSNQSVPLASISFEPRQANLCLRAFVMTNFNCACPAIQRVQGSGFLSEGSS